jgi:acetyl-CoA carboxylase biotin carboxyl carrier protein
MDLKEIQDLIKFVAKSGVNEVEIEMKGVKLVIKTGNHLPPVVQALPVAPTVVQASAPMPVAAPAPASSPAQAPAPKASDDSSRYVEVKSPMIGTFYRRPSPDKEAFVNIGDEIKPGSVLCVIEAMKLFNEIESEISGRIVKVLVDDSSPVEYDTPLFLVDPK